MIYKSHININHDMLLEEFSFNQMANFLTEYDKYMTVYYEIFFCSWIFLFGYIDEECNLTSIFWLVNRIPVNRLIHYWKKILWILQILFMWSLF